MMQRCAIPPSAQPLCRTAVAAACAMASLAITVAITAGAVWPLSADAQGITTTTVLPTQPPIRRPVTATTTTVPVNMPIATATSTVTSPNNLSVTASSSTPINLPAATSTFTAAPQPPPLSSAAVSTKPPPPPGVSPAAQPNAATTAAPSVPSPAPTPTSGAPPAPATQGSAPVFSAPGFTPQAKLEEEPAFEPGQLLVLWTSDEAAASGLATLQTLYQQRPRQRYTLGSLGFTVVMLALPSDREATTLLTQLRTEQPDWVVDRNARSVPMQTAPAAPLAPVSDAAPPRLYAQKMLGTSSVQSPSVPTLKMGVIDSAIDASLVQASALNGSTITLRSVLGPADKPAATTHGNAVLQLLVGKAQDNGFAGSAPPALLHWASAMREQGGKPSTNSLTLVLALDWLLAQQVALVNMSLGGQGDAVLKAAINKLISKNITVLAAAGNNPAANAPPVYPAAYPGVWAITAVDAAGKLYAQAHRASYTTLAAPGVELWVPGAPDAAGSYVSGTSYATALATAALAWQPSTFWSLPAAQQRTQVCAQARKLDANALTGCGLVQKATAP
jgi:minor extracellular protease Epr